MPELVRSRRHVARYELLVGLVAFAVAGYAEGFHRSDVALFLAVFGVVALFVAFGLDRIGRANASLDDEGD